ncbi:hypothetical protein MSAN_02350500 [Mycena sanguinolenta]|uniref:Uncharacterized protein n=1 Tax=Mycena sanguinolenta TaxID=230812 RepID=A0A8H7CH28_9AGAR|nr:hypothetical protein MSAN_02350500 [Mycena sanguinolenta]
MQEIFPLEVVAANALFTEFSDDFELMYVQCHMDRLHMVRPSIHTTSHFAPETVHVGPGIIYSQWGIEHTIGNLGEEIKQHSNAFANLAQQGIYRYQVNALKAMIPNIEPPENPLPRGAVDVGGGYALLHAMDTTSCDVRPCEHCAIVKCLQAHGVTLTQETASVI